MRRYRSPVALAALSLALVAPTVGSCAPKGSSSAKLAALKELRDSGAISPQDYAQRAAALGATSQATLIPAALPLGGAGGVAHGVTDAQLGMEAFKVTAPAGWRVQGDATHTTACSSPPDNLSWTAESPDGAYGSQFIGGVEYGQVTGPQAAQAMSQMQAKGCIFASTHQAADAVRDIYLPRAFPNAQILSVGLLPDSVAENARQAMRAAQARMPDQPYMQSRLSNDGAVVRIAFTQGGRAEQAEIVTSVACTDTRTQFPGQPPLETLDCTLGPVVVNRAPAGKLDAFVASNTVKFEMNPTYQPRVAAIRQQQSDQAVQKINADSQASLAQQNAQTQQILAQGRANVAGIQARGAAIVAQARARSAANDQSNQAFVRYLGGQQQFTDTNGQTFNASNQPNHTYSDGNGHVVQSNSAYPPGAGWTELQGR